MAQEVARSSKICARTQIVSRAAELPRPRVFTNGVFDLLHRGHVECLQQARALGGSLIVGLNSDASVRALHKGPERPLNPEADRACVLAALECVSLVVVFEESTPLALLEALQPEIYVKGGDYDVQRLPEAALMARWGGRALALPYLAGRSTTSLVQRMRAAP
ncbi:adenylyltransferase/cytidyltransferase family protein [Azohydromonas australica]|uniref:adenylyltransferase/cytidyltransferase family protein n=1 Tax=Azohydromonas australica TaxID=364039 RepID=UPI00048EE550|nr:adenylyltransferase/cytidyltransferase family protein [Azohydromonas australica]